MWFDGVSVEQFKQTCANAKFELFQTGEIDLNPGREQTPWYIRTLAGIGGWLAAITFLAFFWEIIPESAVGINIYLGIILVTIATLMYRLNYLTNVFVTQSCFAGAVAGQFLFFFGVVEQDLVTTSESVALLILVTEILIAVAFPYGGQLVLSTFLSTGTFLYLLDHYELPEMVHLINAILVVVVLGTWFFEHRWLGHTAEDQIRSLVYSFTGVLLLIPLLTMEPTGTIGLIFGFHEFLVLAWWPSSLVITAGLLGLAYRESRRLGKISNPDWKVFGIGAGIVLLGLICYRTPGVLVGLLVTGLGFSVSNRNLFGAGLTFFILYLAYFYYDLNLSLLHKSYVLMGSGIVLLGIYGYLHWQFEVHRTDA